MSSTYNITATQGNTLMLTVTANDSNGVPINLSGYSARGYIKNSYSNNEILFDMQPQIDPSYVNGIVNISGHATGMAAMPVGVFPYDLEIESSGGYVTKFLCGYINIFPECTI
jgi:hypothetical protein